MALIDHVEFHKKWFADTTPTNANKATGTLTISGVCKDGETITLGSEVYELDANGSVTAGRIAVDISEGTKVQAGAVLSFGGAVSDGDTVTIGDDVYEFDTNSSVGAGHIAVDVSGGATADAAVTALVAAITASATMDYSAADGTGSTVEVTCDAAGEFDGSAGNNVSVAESGTNIGWVSSVTKLSGGSDCTASEAVTAIAASIEANSTLFDAADGAGDTVVVTCKLVGTEQNDWASTETMTNGAFGATTLDGGSYATPAKTACFIKIGSTWYKTDGAVTKYDESGWSSGTFTTIA